MAVVTERRESVQYIGTNGADIVANFLDSAYTITSDNGAVLILRDSEGSRKAIPLNGWLVRDGSHTLVWQGPNGSYLAHWAEIA